MRKDLKMENKFNEIIEIIEYYGREPQARICMEECAELIQAINKRLRYPKEFKTKANLIEEMADVYICLEQLRYIFAISNYEVDKWIEIKTRRITERYQLRLTKFEYDLLKTFAGDVSQKMSFKHFTLLMDMYRLGYYKDIDINLTLKEILEKTVINDD